MNWLDTFKQWEKDTANGIIYENADTLLPHLHLTRHNAGTPKDRWSSPLKMDGSLPKRPVREKTIIQARDLTIREQGNWYSGIFITEYIRQIRNDKKLYDTYLALAKELNIPLPGKQPDSKSDNFRQSDRKLLLDLDEYFRWNLTNNKSEKAGQVRHYLRKERGFTEEQIKTLGFGFVPSWSNVIRYITVTKGYSKESLDRACQVTNAEGKTSVGQSHTLSIPYICAGKIKGFIFRTTNKDTSIRYIVNAGLDRKSEFFNVPEKIDRYLCVVEGEIDALTATANRITPVAAIGGAAITGDRIRQFNDAINRGMKTLLFCPDLDTYTVTDTDTNNGESIRPDYKKRYNAVLDTIMNIKQNNKTFDDIRIICLDTPGDPDDYIRLHGPEAFIQLIKNATPWWQFLDYEHKKD